jgi:hypothetical protein
MRRSLLGWRGACAAAAVLTCCGVFASGAAARSTRWALSGVVTGSYANAVTAAGNAQCAASYSERVVGVRVVVRSRVPLRYDPATHGLSGRLVSSVRGKWTVSGAYTPLVPQPDGTLVCGMAQTPVSCSARVVFEDGHRVSTSGSARLAVDGTARGTVVSKVVAPRLTERYADAGTPPAGWPAACVLAPDDETIPAAPVFGLSATTVLDRALAAPLRLPTAKLRGHRAFTVLARVQRPAYCPSAAFDPCSEQGFFRLRATLTPAHR